MATMFGDVQYSQVMGHLPTPAQSPKKLSSSSLEATSSSGRPQSLDPAFPPLRSPGLPDVVYLGMAWHGSSQIAWKNIFKLWPKIKMMYTRYPIKNQTSMTIFKQPTTSMHRFYISPPSRTPLDPCEKFDSLSPSASKTPYVAVFDVRMSRGCPKTGDILRKT